jgi:hypothetical protein
MKKNKKPREQYLKVPAHILNQTGIGLCQKVLLAHIYSFGQKGCWQSNQTLAEIFMTDTRTVRRWINDIRNLIYVKNPKGYYRTFWAKSHPEVKSYMDKTGQLPGQKAPPDPDKNGHRVGRKCPTTNNTTITENNKRTIASPSPLPPKGASATLQYRRQKGIEMIEKFKARFGRPQAPASISQEEFEKRRALIRAQLALMVEDEQRKKSEQKTACRD